MKKLTWLLAHTFSFALIAAIVALASPLHAEPPAADTPADADDAVALPDHACATGDTSAIDFFTPGTFKDALAHAKETNRCLQIKLIFFGVDNEGASCATKGKW